jgi:FixJ family two-component response regulator
MIGIVDDDPGVRGSIGSLLRSAGMTPQIFENASELLGANIAELDCIVTDLHMPETTGLELQAELRSRGWFMPLIVMTAFPTSSAREQAMAAGALAFLAKPIDPDALLDAIKGAIA